MVFQLVDWDPQLVEEYYSASFREAELPSLNSEVLFANLRPGEGALTAAFL